MAQMGEAKKDGGRDCYKNWRKHNSSVSEYKACQGQWVEKKKS